MPRIRTIKPEFFTSEQVVECSPNARLLFIGLWCFCDDGGVHPASASRLKMEVFPADQISLEDVAKWVGELIHAGLVESYVYGGKGFWRVTGWHNQKIDKPTYIHPRSREFGEHSASIRRGLDAPSPPESKGVERSRKESNGKESKRASDVDVRTHDADAHLEISEEDRAEVIASCNRVIAVVPISQDQEQRIKDRSLVWKAVVLSRTVLSESWLADSLEAVKAHKGKLGGRPMRYWHGVLASKCEELDPPRNFNALLKRVVVPEDILSGGKQQ